MEKDSQLSLIVWNGGSNKKLIGKCDQKENNGVNL